MSNHLEIADLSLKELIPDGRPPRRLASGALWAEGPVWIPRESCLVFSDVRSNKMLRWSEAGGLSVFREPSNNSNGNTVDREGRLVTCEHRAHRISRTEPDGAITGLVDSYQRRKLNSPNDLVVKSDGTIWFTDPPYGIETDREGEKRPSELGGNYVFRFDPAARELRVMAEDFDYPNGLAFSPDEKTLYIADTGAPEHIRALDVSPDGTLSRSRVFAKVDPPVADGFRVDERGNVWSSAGNGVHVFNPEGGLLGKILLPERAANCCFGGRDGRTLFITATSSLYAIEVSVRDARPWSR